MNPAKPGGQVGFQALSIRELQAYAGACLAAVAEARGWGVPSMRALVNHLVGVLGAHDLSAWDAAGGHLLLTGRGDPGPPDLARCPPEVAAELTWFAAMFTTPDLVD